MSIGTQAAQEQLRTGLAMGGDRAILVRPTDALEPLAVAKRADEDRRAGRSPTWS